MIQAESRAGALQVSRVVVVEECTSATLPNGDHYRNEYGFVFACHTHGGH